MIMPPSISLAGKYGKASFRARLIQRISIIFEGPDFACATGFSHPRSWPDLFI
jgi:hypothetical protein